jgi:uncharacterized membrane protein
VWFLLSLLAALSFTALWILTRLSREMPSNAVTALQALPGPVILWYATWEIDFPWGEPLWQWYLVFPLLLMPIALWALTASVHRTEVTLVKPLSAFSSVCTLVTAFVLFGEKVSGYGVTGVFIITAGLFLLYHGRFAAWRKSGPWLALLGAIIIGVNAGVLAGVLDLFPFVLAVAGFSMTTTLLINGAAAGRSWREIKWSKANILIAAAMIFVNVLQHIFTLTAFLYGPSSYVIAVKRTSLLLTAVIGYVFLNERDQSLTQLLLASGVVVVGVMLLVAW